MEAQQETGFLSWRGAGMKGNPESPLLRPGEAQRALSQKWLHIIHPLMMVCNAVSIGITSDSSGDYSGYKESVLQNFYGYEPFRDRSVITAMERRKKP